MKDDAKAQRGAEDELRRMDADAHDVADSAMSPADIEGALPQMLVAEPTSGTSDVRHAVLNAIKLTLSLTGTFLVTMVVKFKIPPIVGPSAYGQVSFADSFAASFFVFTSFGIDSYIRKEVSTRPGHANDFWAGFWLLRIATALLVCVGMAVGLGTMHKGALEWRLVAIFALAQVAFIHSLTVSSLLQAVGAVNELSLMNVISKLVWGCGVWIGLMLGWPVENIALSFLVSEALKAVYLSKVARERLGLIWRIDMRATWAVILASLPYFLNYMCHRTYAQINVTMLSAMTNDTEVGWYSSASNISSLLALFIPVLMAVVVPLAAKTAQKDVEAMNELMRNVSRLVLMACTPISLAVMLYAEELANLAFGHEFWGAAQSLRMLAPMFPLTYLATLGAMHLIQLDRIWTMVKVSAVALVLNPILNVPMIRYGYGLGPGWAGAMSAVASICTEGANAVITFSILGAAAVDRRLWKLLGMTALVCCSVTGLHYATLGLGLWRVPGEFVAYVGLGLATGALPWTELKQTLENLVHARRNRGGRDA